MFQWSMYYLSFAPLWVSILFLNIVNLIEETPSKGTEITSIVVIPLFFVVSLIVMLHRLRRKCAGSTKYKCLKSASEEKLITAEFLATFIIPLFAFDFTTWKGLSLFVLFFVVFGFLCVRHNYFCTNIMLDVLNYRIYACQLVGQYGVNVEQKIISKRNLKRHQGEPICAKGLNNDYCLDCSE